jgi:hypothetical protein
MTPNSNSAVWRRRCYRIRNSLKLTREILPRSDFLFRLLKACDEAGKTPQLQ